MTEKTQRIVVIGSRGRMGAMLSQRFSALGFRTDGIDLPYTGESLALCRGARLGLLCIPAEAIAPTVEAILPHMEEGTILAESVNNNSMVSPVGQEIGVDVTFEADEFVNTSWETGTN